MLKHCRPDNPARGHLSLLHRSIQPGDIWAYYTGQSSQGTSEPITPDNPARGHLSLLHWDNPARGHLSLLHRTIQPGDIWAYYTGQSSQGTSEPITPVNPARGHLSLLHRDNPARGHLSLLHRTDNPATGDIWVYYTGITTIQICTI